MEKYILAADYGGEIHRNTKVPKIRTLLAMVGPVQVYGDVDYSVKIHNISNSNSHRST